LVAIAQVHAAPQRGPRDAGTGPAPLSERFDGPGTVLGRWILQHGWFPAGLHAPRPALRSVKTNRKNDAPIRAGSRSVRRATQVQARKRQLAAGDGFGDDVLALTHGGRLAGPVASGQMGPLLYIGPVWGQGWHLRESPIRPAGRCGAP